MGGDAPADTPDVPDAADRCAAELVDLGPFGAPTAMTDLNSPHSEDDPAPSDDGLELFFTSDRAPNLGQADMWRTTRASVADAWGSAVRVTELSSVDNENTPVLSEDALTMWFASDRTGGVGSDDLWFATRPDRASPWDAPIDAVALDSTKIDRGPTFYDGDLALVFQSGRGGGTMFEATRASPAGAWSTPAPIALPRAGAFRMWISPCGYEVYYQADPTGSNMDFFYARRSSLADPFVEVRALTELNSTTYDQDLRLSPDRRHAYFSSNRGGANDLFEATR